MKCIGFLSAGGGTSTRLPPMCDQEIDDGFLCPDCAKTCVTRGFWLAALECVEAEPCIIVQDSTRREQVAVFSWRNGTVDRNARSQAYDLVAQKYGSVIKDPQFKWPCFFVSRDGRTSFARTKGFPRRGWTDRVPVVVFAHESAAATVELLTGNPVLPASNSKASLKRITRIAGKEEENDNDKKHVPEKRTVPPDQDRDIEERVVNKAYLKVSSELQQMRQLLMTQVQRADHRQPQDSDEINVIVRKFNKGKIEVESAVSALRADNMTLRNEVRNLYGIVDVLKRKFEEMEDKVGEIDDRVSDIEETAIPELNAKVTRLNDEVIPDMGKEIDNLDIIVKRMRK